MKPLAALGLATVGGVIAWQCLRPQSRARLAARMRSRMLAGMKQMMASLPEDAPPKLIMSVLPKLQAQNEQIVALLREQNELLRAQRADRP